MTALVPNRSLFEFEIAIPHAAKPPTIDGSVRGFNDDARLPNLAELDGQPAIADVWACWNEAGLYFACQVGGKRKALRCRGRAVESSDHICICTDMRDARANRRGTRFCQLFRFLPAGGGRAANEPLAVVGKVKRAREDAPAIEATEITIASRVTNTGYTLTTHIPSTCLAGFDPIEHRRIGLYYMVTDTELGQQCLTVGDDLRWYVDPSTWATGVLEG